MGKTVKRHITFDPVLIRRAECRASQIGVSFPEYLRILVVNDTQPILDEEIEIIDDPETNASR